MGGGDVRGDGPHRIENGSRLASEALSSLAAELERLDGVEAVGETTLSFALDEMKADAGVFALLTEAGDELEVVSSLGYPVEACMGPGRRWAATASIPIAEAVRSGESVRIGSPEEWAARYEMGYVPQSRSSAWAAVPLRRGGGAVGALLWTFFEPRSFSETEVRTMEEFARIASERLARVGG